MRLAIEHRFACRFPAPQARLIRMLRLTPADSHDQTVVGWRIDVDCDARLREGRDGLGNIATTLYVDGPVEGVEIAVVGEVVTSHSGGVLHGVAETLPPAVYRRTTAATAADAAIAAFAREAADGLPPLGTLHALNAALHRRFGLDGDWSGPVGTAVEAFGQSTATPPALAHLFVAGARSRGVPARYVSGYALLEQLDLTRAVPHAWAEAHVDGIGWIGFDPATGLSPEDAYVRVAIGLDAAGAAPVAG